MIDNSESNLYHLEQDINKFNNDNKSIKMKFILGNIKNYSFLKNIFDMISLSGQSILLKEFNAAFARVIELLST